LLQYTTTSVSGVDFGVVLLYEGYIVLSWLKGLISEMHLVNSVRLWIGILNDKRHRIETFPQTNTTDWDNSTIFQDD